MLAEAVKQLVDQPGLDQRLAEQPDLARTLSLRQKHLRKLTDASSSRPAPQRLKPSLPGPPVLRGLLVGLIEHVAAWPRTVVFDRYHPARKELPKLAANRRAFGQATIRHAVFGIVLGLLEDALNDRSA